MTEKLTLLAGGNTVYIYPDASDESVMERVAIQRMVLDVAYPVDDTLVRTIGADKWPDVEKACRDEGIEIVDTRKRYCEARARRGTGEGTCSRLLDEHGNCDRAGDHL